MDIRYKYGKAIVTQARVRANLKVQSQVLVTLDLWSFQIGTSLVATVASVQKSYV